MKNIFLTVVLVICSFFNVFAQEGVDADKNVLPVEQFVNVMKQKPGQLIDVRTPEEYKEGTIKGAININFLNDNFKKEIEQLDPNQPIYIFCQSGKRSAKAHKLLIEEGFKNVYELAGGYNAWVDK